MLYTIASENKIFDYLTGTSDKQFQIEDVVIGSTIFLFFVAAVILGIAVFKSYILRISIENDKLTIQTITLFGTKKNTVPLSAVKEQKQEVKEERHWLIKRLANAFSSSNNVSWKIDGKRFPLILSLPSKFIDREALVELDPETFSKLVSDVNH
jgi:hypothetical protein